MTISRRHFLGYGVLAAADYVLRGDGSVASAEKSPVSVGGWKIAPADIAHAIEQSDDVKNLASVLNFPRLVPLLEACAPEMRFFAHLYLQIGDRGNDYYHIQAMPKDAKTGEIRNFDNLRNAVLWIDITTPQQTDKSWYGHNCGRLPFRPLRVDHRLASAAQIMANVLDVASAINKKRIPYEAANRNLIDSSYPPPANSNASTEALAQAIGATCMDGSPTLGSMYPLCLMPGLGRGLMREVSNSVGFVFRNEVRAGLQALDKLVNHYWQMWDAPALPKGPLLASATAPSPGMT